MERENAGGLPISAFWMDGQRSGELDYTAWGRNAGLEGQLGALEFRLERLILRPLDYKVGAHESRSATVSRALCVLLTPAPLPRTRPNLSKNTALCTLKQSSNM